jgi:predicted Fe-Mo cluster-binding NifX family protein
MTRESTDRLQRIAVPTERAGGLEAPRSDHFGHAAAFVIADLMDDAIGSVTSITNPPHSQGGCMMTVNLLASQGVTAVVAGGMGRGPMTGLAQAGIHIYHSTDTETAGDAIRALADGELQAFSVGDTCQGH